MLINQLFKKIASFFLDLKFDIAFYKKLRFITNGKSFSECDAVVIKGYKKLWRQFQTPFSTKWVAVFSNVNGFQNEQYVPENIYYKIIEPTLNNRIYTYAYSDKNFYNSLYPTMETIFPKVFLRKINGAFYDALYNNLEIDNIESLHCALNGISSFIIKPSAETGGGVGIEKFTVKEAGFLSTKNEVLSLNYLKSNYPDNFIIQEYVEQHPFFSKFNPASVNTIRMFIYRSLQTEKIIPISSVLRIGIGNTLVDNQASGGVSCGINNLGYLNNFAIDKKGNKFEKVNDIDLSKIEQVPFINEMKLLANNIGQKLFYSRLNGIDFSVDKEGRLKVLEINTKNIETNFLQMNNGPLFGEYTDEIIRFCLDHKRIHSVHLKISNS